MRIQAFLTLLFVSILLVSTARAQTPVLHADFDDDTPGELPSTALPGLPDGDYLAVFDAGGEITVQSAYGVMDHNPLVLRRQQTGNFGVQFWVDPELRDCSVYTISWNSMLLKNVQFFYVTFLSPNYQTMGSVEFRGGGQMTANGSQNVLASSYTPGTPQEFQVRLDIGNKTMDVSVDGVPDPQGQDLRHIQMFGNGLRIVGLAFGMIDLYTVVFDDLHVTGEECSSVPTTDRSWGAVKALYR